MKEITKGMSVERVIPPALLGTTKMCGESRMEIREAHSRSVEEGKLQWRRELMVRFAYPLLKQKERIFADSRLFLTPVPIWGGTPLGVVIDWWQNYKCSLAESEKGEQFCIYDWEIGPYHKWGNLCNNDRQKGVYFIGSDNQSHFAPTEHVSHLGKSLEEVKERYKSVFSMHGIFDLEDAIEELLGERVYQRF